MISFSPMGWLRLVGSLKVKVSFAKEPYKRDDIIYIYIYIYIHIYIYTLYMYICIYIYI